MQKVLPPDSYIFFTAYKKNDKLPEKILEKEILGFIIKKEKC